MHPAHEAFLSHFPTEWLPRIVEADEPDLYDDTVQFDAKPQNEWHVQLWVDGTGCSAVETVDDGEAWRYHDCDDIREAIEIIREAC